MHRPAPPHRGKRPSRPATRIPTICIVDSQATDHQRWQEAATAGAVRLQVVADAAAAFRYSRSHRIDLWVIKTELPGLSGFELCAMLKSQSASAAVWLVAKEYTVTAERRAWSSRATVFCCEATLEEHLETVLPKHLTFAHRKTI